jgi:curved DNA-binding protein CbpA
MKFDSPHFDRIRVKPDEDRRVRPEGPACEWPGCGGQAGHRAPKGRNREKEYWNFCLAHVREYNQSYNFFSGMSDNDVAQYQKDSLTGHRPTWKIGMNGPISDATKRRGRVMPGMDDASDPFNVFQEVGGRRSRPDPEHKTETRMIRNAERKAFDALGLENSASKADIKSRFKDLVKRHHPDANGGDRSTEDRLREVIQAYNYLKSVGFA